ncbi:Hypothetical predicted protein [Cloeon dipterum]|uniref:C-type lectin domain-containing protein n=1 Tax=Cloeon dipterum TaxID=197152 RepID=A0A8S1DP30_9INSE|nr:Hypothetical predicted protein [Cloeon dipterum]
MELAVPLFCLSLILLVQTAKSNFLNTIGGDERFFEQARSSVKETEKVEEEAKCPVDDERKETKEMLTTLIAEIRDLKNDVAALSKNLHEIKEDNSRILESGNSTRSEEINDTLITPPQQEPEGILCGQNQFNVKTLKNGKKYHFSRRQVDWYTAKEICENNTMHLASPKTMEEFKTLRDHLMDKEIFDSKWLSASDVGRMGKGFVWHDGEELPADSPLWGDGPYSYGAHFGEEFCVHTGITLLGEQIARNGARWHRIVDFFDLCGRSIHAGCPPDNCNRRDFIKTCNYFNIFKNNYYNINHSPFMDFYFTCIEIIRGKLQPVPCSLSCADYNSFLESNPTSGSQEAKGTKKTSNCGMEYFVSTSTATRNEAAMRCKELNMTLLTVTSLEGLECLNNFEANTFWTSGSKEDGRCHLENQYVWCSTGFNFSRNLIESEKIWLPTNEASPSATERCLAVSISSNSSNQGLVHRKCDYALPFICQYSVDCPQLCSRDESLFDSSGILKDKKSYGIWLDIGNYTYLLGNKPMAWLDNYQQCCTLGMEALNIDSAAEQLGLTALVGANKGNWTANFNYWTSGTWNGAPVKQWAWCEPTGPTVFVKGLVWEPSQPDNKGGNESCVHFRFTLNSTGTILTDRNCTNKYIFACKSALKTTPKPCVAFCPINSCERNSSLFDTVSSTTALRNFFSYGNWYDGCGRNFLTYNSKLSNWTVARNSCCEIGLTLASMESAGKSSCFSRIVSKFAPSIFGDFWLSGTDLGCDSNFRWCTLSRDFVDPEVTWKEGHPKPGLDCVYLEVRSGSMLLATDDCAQTKNFLCEVRKKGTFQRAMQTECAETWDITVDQIDLLLNVSAFLTATMSLNLKFGVGGLDALATLRQIELVSQEDPVKLETGFVAYDLCSGIKSDDECVIADETFKCGQEKAPDLVSKIIANNFDNNTMLYPPTPCVPVHRTCWISNSTPCVKNTNPETLRKLETGHFISPNNRHLQ